MKKLLWIVLLAVANLLVESALAVQPDEMLKDPELEARAREISKELRCVVCQNENIDSSTAPLAKDLRILVRERLKGGDTNEEVIDFVVARYGEFVLLRPRVRPGTWFLWFGPLLFFLAGAGLAWYFFRTQRNVSPAEQVPLNADERRRLDELLDQEISGRSGEGS